MMDCPACVMHGPHAHMLACLHAGATNEEDERRAAYDAQLGRLRAEIDELRLQIDKERTKWVVVVLAQLSP